LNAVEILVCANILSVAIVGINVPATIRFVQNVEISWVTQNPNICFTIVECSAISNTEETQIETHSSASILNYR
jgi:hypothetical protein